MQKRPVVVTGRFLCLNKTNRAVLHLAPAVLLAAFAAAFTANALHSTPVYDSLKERILDQRRRRRAAASPTEERS